MEHWTLPKISPSQNPHTVQMDPWMIPRVTTKFKIKNKIKKIPVVPLLIRSFQYGESENLDCIYVLIDENKILQVYVYHAGDKWLQILYAF